MLTRNEKKLDILKEKSINTLNTTRSPTRVGTFEVHVLAHLDSSPSYTILASSPGSLDLQKVKTAGGTCQDGVGWRKISRLRIEEMRTSCHSSWTSSCISVTNLVPRAICGGWAKMAAKNKKAGTNGPGTIEII